MDHNASYLLWCMFPPFFFFFLSDFVSQVALFLRCMPIIAAPMEAIAVLGFVSAGIPVYYVTQVEGDKPRIIGTFLFFSTDFLSY